MNARRPASATIALLVAGLVAAPAASPAGGRIDVGHRLSIVVPSGWRISHRSFTPCTDPIERFSLIRGGQILMIQERLKPVPAELSPRSRQFRVRGEPSPLECCSIPGRRGWILQFGDHGRAFYAYLYPGGQSARTLLALLDTFRAR
jgi:hypothetical protein